MPKQVYTIEIDGRQYDIEGDRPPTEAEALAVVESLRTEGLPEGGLGGALDRLSRVERPISDTGEEYSDFGTRLQDFGASMAHPTSLGGVLASALPTGALPLGRYVRDVAKLTGRAIAESPKVSVLGTSVPTPPGLMRTALRLVSKTLPEERAMQTQRQAIQRAGGASYTPNVSGYTADAEPIPAFLRHAETVPAAASPAAQAVERLSASGPVTQGTSVPARELAAQELAASPSFRNLPTHEQIWADLPPAQAPVKLTTRILVERAAKAANITLTADEANAAVEFVNQGRGLDEVIAAVQHMRAQQVGGLELPASWNALPTPTEAQTRFTKGMRGKAK